MEHSVSTEDKKAFHRLLGDEKRVKWVA